MTGPHKTGQGEHRERERRREIEKAKEGRKRKEHIIRSHAHNTKNFDQQRAEELEKDLAARLNRQQSIEKEAFQSKSRLGSSRGRRRRRWSATEGAGMSAVSALRDTGLFSEAFRGERKGKRRLSE